MSHFQSETQEKTDNYESSLEMEQNSTESPKRYEAESSERSGTTVVNNNVLALQAELDAEERSINGVDALSDLESQTEQQLPPIQKTESRLSKLAKKLGLGFFDSALSSQRMSLLWDFGFVYFLMGFFILGIFSIYWGSMYKRTERYKDLKMLVVIEDNQVGSVSPFIGEAISQIAESPELGIFGDWEIIPQAKIAEDAAKRNETVREEIRRKIHHQLYWTAIYVRENATFDLYEALKNGDTTFEPSSQKLIEVLYETGRDFYTLSSYVTPFVNRFEKAFLNITAASVYIPLAALLTPQQVVNATEILAQPPTFVYTDRIPYTNPVLLAPLQVGLIYLVILTFFQFNFFLAIHMKVASFGLKPFHYLLYRYGASFLSYFILSLVYCFVTLAFQVDINVTFGKSSFLVLWGISFLTMCSLGVWNELAALIAFATYPPVVGFWMLFWVVINISATFSPIALTPKFYRFGYGTPIHNSYEATKVVLFNTYKGEFGRNMGIIIAWIIIGNVLFPFVLKFSSKRMIAKKQAEIAGVIAKHEASKLQ